MNQLFSLLIGFMLTSCSPAETTESPKFQTGYLYKVESAIPGKEVYICGQRPFNASGELVGPGNLSVQTKQVFDNLQESLRTVGMTLRNVTQVTYMVKGSPTTTSVDSSKAQAVNVQANSYFSIVPNIIEMKSVAQNVREDVLIEIEVIAVK